MTHPDDAGRRLSEALQAQAGRSPMPPPTARPPRAAPPPPPPRVPGRMPPPVPRPGPPPSRPGPVAAPAPVAPAARPGSDGRQIVWALVVTLLVGAVLGGGLALLSVLLPGLLPTIG